MLLGLSVRPQKYSHTFTIRTAPTKWPMNFLNTPPQLHVGQLVRQSPIWVSKLSSDVAVDRFCTMFLRAESTSNMMSLNVCWGGMDCVSAEAATILIRSFCDSRASTMKTLSFTSLLEYWQILSNITPCTPSCFRYLMVAGSALASPQQKMTRFDSWAYFI